MKKRLFAGFSPSNAINVLAVLDSLPQYNYKNYYAFLGQKNLFDETKNILNHSKCIEKTYNLASNSATFNIETKQIEKIIDIKSFDEIYLQFNGADFRVITRKYKKATIFLIEDGLSSYIKQPSTLLFHKKPFAIYSYNYLENFLPHECRYNNIKNIPISHNSLKKIYSTLNTEIPPIYNQNSIILCTQDLFTTNIITYEEELKMYSDCIALMLEKNYNVFLKEHPRTKFPFFPKLKGLFNDNRFNKLPQNSIPIEIYISKFKPKAIVSVFSTAMFLASDIFGCPVYGLNYYYYKTNNYSLKNFDFASLIAKSKFKPVDQIDLQTLDKVSFETKSFLLSIKELELYKIFISKKTFYKFKHAYKKLQITDDLLKKYQINKAFAQIIENGFYFDLILHNLPIYKQNIKLYTEQLIKAKSPTEFCCYCLNGLKILFNLIF